MSNRESGFLAGSDVLESAIELGIPVSGEHQGLSEAEERAGLRRLHEVAARFAEERFETEG